MGTPMRIIRIRAMHRKIMSDSFWLRPGKTVRLCNIHYGVERVNRTLTPRTAMPRQNTRREILLLGGNKNSQPLAERTCAVVRFLQCRFACGIAGLQLGGMCGPGLWQREIQDSFGPGLRGCIATDTAIR